jgi:hypothetical protein
MGCVGRHNETIAQLQSRLTFYRQFEAALDNVGRFERTNSKRGSDQASFVQSVKYVADVALYFAPVRGRKSFLQGVNCRCERSRLLQHVPQACRYGVEMEYGGIPGVHQKDVVIDSP